MTPSVRARIVSLSAHPNLDWRTVCVLALLWVGLAAAYEGHRRGGIPSAAVPLIGLAAMNLAFTVWHEGIHKNISTSPGWNHTLGRLAAIPVFLPYTRLCVNHALHHRYTNDPARDPDQWQIDGPYWTLAFRYLRGERQSRRIVAAADPQAAAATVDLVQVAVSGLVLLGLLALSPSSALLAIVVPRVLLVYTHALYVNYLPHAQLPPQGSGEETRAERPAATRLLRVPLVLSLAMLRHDRHALHHAWPGIPWHRYAEAHSQLHEELASQGVPTASLAEAWQLLDGPREATP